MVQDDLPLVERPFAAYGELIGCDEATVLELLRAFKERKLMRRFAAVMNHRTAGFKANAMGVWAVPEDQLDEIGPQMAGFALVSHCYRRPTYDDWPYSVFTMVHGKNAKDCETTIAAIHDETGIDEYALLWSVKEYKKTRVRYFTDDWDDWRREHLPCQASTALGRRRRALNARRSTSSAARADTPGCHDVVHLNNAGASLPTRRVVDTVVEHLELEARDRRVRGGRRGRRAVGRGVRLGRRCCSARQPRRDRARRERDARVGHGLLLARVDVRARRPRPHVALRVREQRDRVHPGARSVPASPST